MGFGTAGLGTIKPISMGQKKVGALFCPIKMDAQKQRKLKFVP
jgi:hypothetical protein